MEIERGSLGDAGVESGVIDLYLLFEPAVSLFRSPSIARADSVLV